MENIITKLDINNACLEELKLHGRTGKSDGVVPVAGEPEVRRTVDINMVNSGNPSSDLPLDSSVDFYVDQNSSGGFVLLEDLEREGGDGDGGGVEVGGPDGGVAVALVGGGEGGGDGDLLAAVGGVGVEFGVVNSDAVVGVEGGEGDLHGEGEGVGGWGNGGRGVAGGGEVEGVDGGVLEDEAGFGGAEDDPDEEDHQEDEEDEAEDRGEYAAEELTPLLVVVAALLGAHG